MKKLLLIILAIIPPVSFAQEAKFDDIYNFKMVNKSTIWQYVYTTDKSDADIIKYFKDAKLFQIDNSDTTTIHGTVTDKPIEYKKFGFTTMGTPMFISNSNCSYNVSIDIQNSRYRVTISQVMFSITINLNSKYVSTNNNQIVSLDTYSYDFKRNRFKPSFSAYKADKILATVWYNTYLLNNDTSTQDNW